MNRMQEEQIKASLVRALNTWIAAPEEGLRLPLLGDSTVECMAEAALAVLRGVADLHEYMADSGMLTDD